MPAGLWGNLLPSAAVLPDHRPVRRSDNAGGTESEVDMPNLLIVYGTRDGHTAEIAQAAAATARTLGWDVAVLDARAVPRGFTCAPYDAAIVAAPVNAGRYPGYVRAFVQARRAELAAMPTAFISVSWSATRQPWAPPLHQRERADERFFRDTGWRPGRVIPVGGAIPYTRHNWPARWLWSLFIRRAGGPHDLRRDYDFTDWEALRRETTRLLSEMAQQVPEAS